VIVAGEASGDLHGAHVVRELKNNHPDLLIQGVGGPAMRAAGTEILIEAAQLAVVGITEVFSKIPHLWHAMTRLKRLLETGRPDLLILIDFPDFNLHLAATAKRRGIPVLYYISPQIWAWRSGRIKKLKARIDHIAVILPFEKEYYRQNGVAVSFVGHPLMDSLERISADFVQLENIPKVVGLFPGSRDSEVNRLLPEMLSAAYRLRNKIGDLRFIVSRAPTIDSQIIERLIEPADIQWIEISEEPAHEIFRRCRLVIAASGTVTLEAAICTTPMVIVYKVSPLSYLLGRLMIKVDHIGLVNLIAGRRLVPELIQHQVTAERIASHVLHLLSDSNIYDETRKGLMDVRRALGSAGASRRVAQCALSLMGCPHVF
jgi:lipid-A-disaccharide synthase